MTRLCLIGNSHLGAMMFAWKRVANEFHDLKIDYYGGHEKNLVLAHMGQDERLNAGPEPFRRRTAEREQSREQAVDFENYDAVVLVGLAFGPKCTLQPYRRYAFSGLNRHGGQVVSKENYKRAALRHASETAALHIANLLSGRVRLFLVPCALPAERGFLATDKRHMEVWKEAAEFGDGDALMGIFREICDDLSASGIQVIPQPEATRATSISTLQLYNDNVPYTKAGEIRPDDDFLHMNGDYGEVVWRLVFKALVETGILSVEQRRQPL